MKRPTPRKGTRAVALKPDYASALWNESLTRLLLGDFEAGWKLYEWRWRVELTQWPAGIPQWRGEEALDGKTIVLHAEQGLGDAIQFCRYAKLVAARGATVLLQVRPALGKPVWELLPFTPDWRWLLDRDDSPWYPTARLFRQTAIGDWGPVLSRVRDKLTATL